MKSTVPRLVALALLASAAAGQEPPAVPAFPTQAEAITADVVVLDKDGRPVRGLTREDFTLLEDGKPQPIVAFEARELAPAGPAPRASADERVATNERSGARGRTFAFLLDDLGTSAVPMEEAKKAIVRWLEEKADPRDDVTLVTASGSVWWSDRVDRGKGDLEAVLDRVKGGKLRDVPYISDWEAYRIAVFEDASGAAAESAGPAATANGPPVASSSLSNPNLLGSIANRVGSRIGWPAGQVRMLAMNRYNVLNRRTRTLLGATERLSRGLAGARGRKSILVFSEGFLYDPDQRTVFDRAIDASQRANTAIYFVDVGGLGGQSLYDVEKGGPPQDPREIGVINMEEGFLETTGTEQVADNTGGTSIRNTNDLLGGLTRVAEESSTYYLLGYQPEKAPDGHWHTLEVKVARPGMTVRTRHGYQATPQPALASLATGVKGKASSDHGKKDKVPKRPLDPAVLTSGAADALPLRLAPYVLDVDQTGQARVLVVVELDTSRLTLRNEGARRTGAVDLTLVGTSRDLGKTFPLDERVRIDLADKAAGGWMTLSRELRLPPGVAQVRALARDVASGLAGSVTERLEVPAPGEAFVATPVVTDRMIVAKGGAPRLVPVAHRRFRPRGYLYCSYEVFGMTNAKGEATTHVTGGFTLRAADGRIVRQASPTPIAVALGGRVVRLFALPLAGLATGDYELVVDVVDESTGRSLQSREPFALEPSAS